MHLFNVLLRLEILLLLSAAAEAGHLPGDTITNGKGTTLQPSVCNKILEIERTVAPACRNVRIVQTAIVGEPRRLGLRINQWTERWTVNRCGKKIFYVIRFDFRGSVGTFNIEGPKGTPDPAES